MRLHRVPREVADLIDRVEALEEWRAAQEDDDDTAPEPYKPIRRNKPLDTEPLDGQAMMREVSAELAYGWGDDEDWRHTRNSPNGYL